MGQRQGLARKHLSSRKSRNSKTSRGGSASRFGRGVLRYWGECMERMNSRVSGGHTDWTVLLPAPAPRSRAERHVPHWPLDPTPEPTCVRLRWVCSSVASSASSRAPAPGRTYCSQGDGRRVFFRGVSSSACVDSRTSNSLTVWVHAPSPPCPVAVCQTFLASHPVSLAGTSLEASAAQRHSVLGLGLGVARAVSLSLRRCLEEWWATC